MQELVFFLGRFHVLALHLPIGLVFAAIGADWLSRRPGWSALSAAVPLLWGATAISAVLTVALGYMHFTEGGFSGSSASLHRFYGTLVAAVCLIVWWMSAVRPSLHRRLGLLSGLVVLGLVTITGHYGGNLTHGSDYLVAYAPQPLRAMLGLGERRPPVTDLAAADPWYDLVAPMLEARCSTCHNDDKRSAEFSVVDYESTLAGGETGSAIVPGDAELSELLRRVSLPEDNDAFMPAEGKTPLTADQVEILYWWIDAGAPVDVSLGSVGTPPDIEPLLRAAVGLDGPGDSAPMTAAAIEADPAVVDSLFAAGFLVRRLSQSDPRLMVSVYSVGTPVGVDQLSALREAAEAVVRLDLQDAGLDDTALEGFDRFSQLESLRLSKNSITDAGVRRLAALPKLEVLNLYGNRGITDDALDSIASMASLEAVYLWDTAVTPEGIAELAAARPHVSVNAGSQAFPEPSEGMSAR